MKLTQIKELIQTYIDWTEIFLGIIFPDDEIVNMNCAKVKRLEMNQHQIHLELTQH